MLYTSLCVATASVLLLCVPATTLRAGGAQDANALVRRMIAVYRNAQTIQENAEAKVLAPGGGMYIQTSSIKWKRPNLAYLFSQDPQQGTLQVFTDGKLITLYSQKQNIYTRRNAPPDLKGTLDVADKAAQDAFRIPISQVLNPISFLLSTGMPREAKSFRFAGETNLNGKRTFKVVGQAEPAWLQSIVPQLKIVPVKRDVMLWIDAQSSLLLKAMGTFTWKVTAVNGTPLPKTTMAGFMFEESHRGTLLNAPISEEDFRFKAPKGARQLFQERTN